MSAEPPRARVRAWTILGVALLALATYANSTANGFVLDDGYLIEANPHIRSLRSIPHFFATDLFDRRYPAAMYYRPLVPLSFALEYAVVGANPFLYHLTNVLLHALVCALVYLLALRLFDSQRLAWVAAAVFAVHPVHSEAVTAISGRGDLLSATLLLTAGLLYAGSARRLGLGGSTAILACTGLALLSKESSLVALALFPLIDLATHEQRGRPLLAVRRILRERALLWLGLACAAAAFLAVRQSVTSSPISASSLGFMGSRYALDVPLTLKLASCVKLLGIYFELLVFPLELSADYDYNQIPLATGWLDVAVLLPGLAMLALLVVVVRSYPARPAIFFGGAFLLVGVLPLAFVLPFSAIVLAERYLYLPSLGLCILLGALFARVPLGATRAATAALIALVILPAAGRTIVRNRDWRDNETLFAATVAAAPNSARAQASRAATLAARGQIEQEAGNLARAAQLFEQALPHYQRALAIDPLAGHVRAQYGVCLAALGRFELAEAELRAAMAQGRPEAVVTLYRLLVQQIHERLAASPEDALRLHARAQALLRDQIRPASPPQESARMQRELDELRRELARARAGSGESR